MSPRRTATSGRARRPGTPSPGWQSVADWTTLSTMMDQGRGAGGDLVGQTSLGRRGWWILVPLEVAGRVTVEMVPDTGSFASSSSERTLETRVGSGVLDSDAKPPYLLRNVAIQGHPLADRRV